MKSTCFRAAILCCTLSANVAALADERPTTSKADAWNHTLRGANYDLYENGLDEDLRAAKGYGMNLFRVFISPIAEQMADNYFESQEFDQHLDNLARRIDRAHAFELKVVLTASRVPGRQFLWVQDGKADRRLWQDPIWQERFAAYWQRIARRFAEHPAVIGYDILNEPRPEQTAARDRWTQSDLAAFYREAAGTVRDLNVLYARSIRAIREVDSQTPIVLSCGLWGSPMAMFGLEPIRGDDKIVYTFHWYAPERYTIWRTHKGKWQYPGDIPEDGYELDAAPMVHWDIDTHRRRMADPVRQWQKTHNIPSNRIYLGEFSADRRLTGADQWNQDVIRIAEDNGWHWTYYSFREREWNSRDFELGPKREPPPERTLTPLMKTFVDVIQKDKGG